jgi:hypothetical protein
VTSPLRALSVAAVLATVFAAGPAFAKVFLTTDEALALAFPDCRVERRTVYLTKEQLSRATAAAGQPVTQGVVNPYQATCDGAPGGTAYFDVHRVRTLPEAVMVVVDPEGKVRRIEVLSFNEPVEYLPRPAWYAQFTGRGLDDGLALKQAIRPIAGATLTARATTEAVRRVLALHQVLAPAESHR